MNATATQTRVSFKNILYATDFSAAAESALPYVLGLAQAYGAKVHALHVRSPYPLMVGPEAMPDIMEAERQLAEQEARQLHGLCAGVPHEVFVRTGNIWNNLDEVARLHTIDLIVVGTRGRTGVGRALLGSVAEEIFRRAPCPVLTVGPHVSRDTKRRLEMKKILYATDFSPESLIALPYAVSLAQEHQAQLTILHVIDKQKTGELVHAGDYVESILQGLRNMVPSEAKPWCEPCFRVEHGIAAEKILEVAAARGTDLIVLGLRAAEGLFGSTTHLFRPTAHRVVTHAECPVLTVRG